MGHIILPIIAVVGLLAGPAMAASLDGLAARQGVDLPGDTMRTQSWPLGKIHSSVLGLGISPYLEVDSPQPAQPAFAMAAPGQTRSGGHFLVGALAATTLRPHVTLSLDAAAGKPFLADGGNERSVPGRRNDDDGGLLWRTGVTLGYAVAPRFHAFAVAEFGHLQIDPTPARPSQGTADTVESALRFGFSYRF